MQAIMEMQRLKDIGQYIFYYGLRIKKYYTTEFSH